MSAIQPPFDLPTPAMIPEPDPIYESNPVEKVEPTTPSRAAESNEQRPDDVQDEEVVLSAEGRTMFQEAMDARRAGTAPRDAVATESDILTNASLRNTPALRELLQSFRNYDNAQAIREYNSSLDMFTRYGAGEAAAGEPDAVSALRGFENDAYRYLGISYRGFTTREIRESIGLAIDRWFAGQGVFTPEMLRFPSSDGFRFSPLSQASRAALRAADVMAGYDRPRIATYLREMARLTPNDFMFYDPTGLDTLALQQRRDLMRRIDSMLREEQLDARAAELRFTATDDTLALNEEAIADQALSQRIEDMMAQINTYYGQLTNSVRQYNAGVVSDAMT